MSKVQLEDRYVVTGVGIAKDHNYGKRQYVGIDGPSGYECWTTFMSSDIYFTDLEEAIKRFETATSAGHLTNRGVGEVRIAVVRTTLDLEAVDTTYIDEERKQAALDKLTEEEKRLLGLNELPEEKRLLGPITKR